MLRSFLLFSSLLCLLGSLRAQEEGVKKIEKYQITVLLAPSIERLSDRNIKLALPLEWKPSYHVGMEYKRFLDPDLSFSTGFFFQNKGFKTRPRILRSDGTFDDTKRGNIIVSARYLTVPVGFDKHFTILKKLHFMISGGVMGGYLVNQTFNGKRFDAPDNLRDPIFGDFANEVSNIRWFNKRYFAWNVGVGFIQYIKSKFVVVAQPMYQRQFSNALDPEGALVGYDKPRLDSFSLDLKAGYFFNKQIKNARKSF
jgi:hypothetical protein